MSQLDKHIDLFDQVLNQQLDAEAMVVFEKQLVDDAALKLAFEEYQSSVLLVQSASIFEEMGAVIDQNEGGKHVPFYQKHWRVMGIAASVSFVIAFAITWLVNSQKSPEALYLTYFEPYPDLISERSALSSQNAMFQYNSGNYAQAIVLFEGQESLTLNERLYLGISYLGNGDHESAEDFLLALLSTEKEGVARWYLGLVYLAMNEPGKAIEVLKQIGPEGFQYQSATEILDTLE